MTLFEYNSKVIDDLWEDEFAELSSFPEPEVTLLTIPEQRREIMRRWARTNNAESEICDALATMGKHDFGMVLSAFSNGDHNEFGRLMDVAIREYWRRLTDEGF